MHKVIIDCDPGHDDALAILLAGQHLKVLGITTVAGNQTLEKVTVNALKVLALMDRTDIPVHSGMHAPLLRPPHHAGHIHGETGMDGPVLPAPRQKVEDTHAVNFLIETARSIDDVWLVPVGPLTNVAMAIRQAPDIVGRLAGISLMGGSLTHGNATPTAEFNIWFDAEAARIVFESGIPIKMCGLNLTHQANVTDAVIARIAGLDNEVGNAVAELLRFYLGTVTESGGIRKAAMHDPCAMAALIDSDLIDFEPMHVSVETVGVDTYGMTVCDYRHLRGFGTAVVEKGPQRGQDPNAEVGMSISEEAFWDLLVDALRAY